MNTKSRLSTLIIIIVLLLLYIAYLQGKGSLITPTKIQRSSSGSMSCMGSSGCDMMNSMKSGDSMGTMKMDHSNVVSEEQFIRDMIPHHQEAVDTSKIIVARSTNTALVTLAQGIIDAQTTEIAMMKGWLKTWYLTSTGVAHYTNMMPNLAVLSGVELDNKYLMGMVMHHQGAIQMAEGVLKLTPRDQIKGFAKNVIAVQSKEIQEMKGVLDKSMPTMDHSKMMMK